jgi:thiamine-phosphate pyrophosphorylase
VPTDLAAADALADEAHRGQTRRHGTPYVEHPRAVRRIVDDLAHACRIAIDDDVRATALLHDVLEDSEHDEASLSARVGPAVTARVGLLTKHGKGEAATAAYYERLMKEADARTALVKVADRCHNLSELHKAPNRDKLKSYVEETLRYLVPLARTAAPGLERALGDAMRAALRAQRVPFPSEVAEPARRVPRGLYAIVEPKSDVDALVRQVRALCEGGVALVQLRAKGIDDREILELCACVQIECARFDVPLLINDRADLCVATAADGLHVGQTDLPAHIARRIVGREVLIGTSSHTLAQAEAAAQDDTNDYVAIGPVYASPTKVGHAPIVSTLGLREVADKIARPVVAIGGITDPVRAADVAAAGAHLAAAISAVAGEDPHAMARRMSLAFFAAAPAPTRS